MKTIVIIFGMFIAGAASAQTIVCPPDAPANVKLAAKEIRRYVYLRTGEMLPIADTGKGIKLKIDPALGAQEYRITSDAIIGGSDVGVLYGAYRYAELLGVRFYLHGDTVPDERLKELPAVKEETGKPLFALRGIQPFHIFPEGPDWWSADDYKSYLAQIAKMKMNFIGLHSYGEEPLIWKGLAEDVNADGTVNHSAPSHWASISGGSFGYAKNGRTSDFAAGAALLFPGDDYGSPIVADFLPKPASPQECNEAFNRAGKAFGDIFSFAHDLGIRVCVGTHAPVGIPAALRERLKETGLDPNNPDTIRKIYEGMFTRIQRTYPLDYYWLWTSESWLGGAAPDKVEAVMNDIRAATAASKNLGSPFPVGTSGWVLGPRHDSTLFDRQLPPDAPMSAINGEVGFLPVTPAFASIKNRPKWAIPWMEDDANMTGVQFWVGRIRRDAADAHAYGCDGLFGIHWRTRLLAPNFAALSQAGWQQPWNPEFGRRGADGKARLDIRKGGRAFASPKAKSAPAQAAGIYQTACVGVQEYRIQVPDGVYKVTLQFCETAHQAAGHRVFDVAVQGKTLAKKLDLAARASAGVPFELTSPEVTITSEPLTIAFSKDVDQPLVSGIVIDGKTAVFNQLPSRPFTRRINCGGPALAGYEADFPEAGAGTATVFNRDLPCDDFYADWARAEFGTEVSGKLAKIFSSLDGGVGDYRRRKGVQNIPRPTDWIGGPGGITPNPTPWNREREKYRFADEMQALRPLVKGAGNLERFDYWLNTFKFLRACGELGCTRGRLDALVKRGPKAAAEALATRIALNRQWEIMMTFLLQTVTSSSELGTIANLEQHTLRGDRAPQFITRHDEQLTKWLGKPFPPEAQNRKDYRGAARLIVPTARNAISRGESLNLKIIALANPPVKSVTVHLRPLGKGEWKEIPATHIARAVYEAKLPASREDFEYYITAGDKLLWPATAPQMNQTVVIAE